MAKRKTKQQGYGRTSRQYEIENPDGTVSLFDSVTSILGVINKPALIPWAANLEREYCLEVAQAFYGDVRERGTLIDPLSFSAGLRLRLGTQKAHQKALKKAGNIGTEVHAQIEWSMRHELGQDPGPQPSLSAPAALAWAEYQKWRESVGLVPLTLEQAVWSRAYEYAGTLDTYAEATRESESVKFVADWKTGKAIYPEARLQIAAYGAALQEMGHAHSNLWGVIVRLPKVESDPGMDVEWISPEKMKANLDAFLGVKRLWDWQQGG